MKKILFALVLAGTSAVAATSNSGSNTTDRDVDKENTQQSREYPTSSSAPVTTAPQTSQDPSRKRQDRGNDNSGAGPATSEKR